MRKLIKVILAFLLLLWLLSKLDMYVISSMYWPLAFITIFYPLYVMLSLLILALLSLWNWRNIILLIAFFIFSYDTVSYTGMHTVFKRKSFEKYASQITLLTHNVDLFEYYVSGKFDMRPWIMSYRRFNPSVVFLQECYLPDTSFLYIRKFVLEPLSLAHYVFVPYARVKHKGFVGFLTASQFPIIYTDKIRNVSFMGKKIIALRTDIVLFDTDTVSFLNVHLQSYQFNQHERNVLDVQDFDKKSSWKLSMDFFSKFRSNVIARDLQARYILSYVDSLKHDVFLVGDFNELPWSHVHKRFSYRFIDAFMQKGSLNQFKTLNFFVPLRVDYMFYPRKQGWRVVTYEVGKIKLNDHLPVACRFVKE